MPALHLRSLLPLLATGLTIFSSASGDIPVFNEDFETGAPGFTFSGLWHISTNYPGGGASALAFCENETAGGTTPDGDYNVGQVEQSCFSGPIVIPSGTWDLAFDAFNGDEYSGDPTIYDRLSVGVSLDGVTIDRVIASSAPQNGGSSIPEWNGPGSEQYNHVVASLADYAGQTIHLVFTFATLDPNFNNFPGARIDNLTIVPGIPQPVAVDDRATTNGAPVIIQVLANDQSPSGQPLSIANLYQGYYGAVSDNGDGTLTYTPGPDYDGRDFFGYNITDGTTESEYATVAIRNSTPLYKDIAVIRQPVPAANTGTNFSAVTALPDESLGHFLGKYKSSANYGAIFNYDGTLALDTTLIPNSGDGAHIGTFYAPSGDGGRAKLKVGTGAPAVTSASDSVVLADLFSFPLVVAREGGPAPGTLVTFKSFTSVTSVYSYGVSGTAATPGDVKTNGAFGYNGTTFFTAKLNGATSKTDFGLWAYQDYEGTVLMTRTGDSLNGKTVKTITALKGGSGTAAQNRATTPDGGCLVRIAFTDKTQAIGEFVLSNFGDGPVGSFYPFAQTTDPTPIANTSYVSFGIPAVSHGTLAFTAKIAGSGISGVNNSVLVVNDAVVAQKGQAVPGLSGATFASFKDPVAGGSFDPGGNAAFSAKLHGAGLSSVNNSVLCHWDGTQLASFARTGDAAPGTADTFDSFTSLALGTDLTSGPVFVAKLSSAKQTGLWSSAPDNTVTLLALDGGSVPSLGQLRQLKALGALKAAGGSTGNGRGYDDFGHAFVLATFVDGTKSLIQITTP